MNFTTNDKAANRFFWKSLCALCLLLTAACAGLEPNPGAISGDVQTETLNTLKARAASFEAQGELRLALLSWKAAATLGKSDETAAQQVLRLEKSLAEKARYHFDKGLRYLDKGDLKAAENAFLTTLRYDPDHAGALEKLRTSSTRRVFHYHEIKPGETLDKIARQFYHDPGKAFLLAKFNDLDSKAALAPGLVIKVPIVDQDLMRQTFEPYQALEQSRELMKAGHYQDALTQVQGVLQQAPQNAEARHLKNTILLKLADTLTRQAKFPAALEVLQQVDPGFKGLQNAVDRVHQQVRENQVAREKELAARQQEANLHYQNGIKLFVNEELEKAILEWKKTLALDPQHGKARDYIRKAQDLLEKLKAVQ